MPERRPPRRTGQISTTEVNVKFFVIALSVVWAVLWVALWPLVILVVLRPIFRNRSCLLYTSDAADE